MAYTAFVDEKWFSVGFGFCWRKVKNLRTVLLSYAILIIKIYFDEIDIIVIVNKVP